ncbi:carboxylate--amine ligase [bacterium]|nr:carboxylate--amine ligase [bacterium]
MERPLVNFVYLSPHFPPNYHDFLRGLHEIGVRVLGIGETPHAELGSALQGWIHEYYRVESLLDYDQVYRAFAHFISQHGRIDRVDSNAEFWMETEARLRTDFNLVGYRSADMERMKRKSVMKQIYREAGVPVARGALASDRKAALALARNAGYPLVAKPDVGVGAAATYRLDDAEQLKQFLDQPHEVEYFLEEFLSGQLVTYDGLANAEAEPIFVASHLFNTGIMEVVNQRADLFYWSAREIAADLDELGRKVLKAFDVRKRFFHLEFFRTPNGLRALEANLRAPGALTTNMMCYANDIDIFRIWAELVCDQRTQVDYSRPYHVGYFARWDDREYQHSLEEIKQRFPQEFVLHRANEEIFRKATGDQAIVLRSGRMEPLEEARQFIFALK